MKWIKKAFKKQSGKTKEVSAGSSPLETSPLTSTKKTSQVECSSENSSLDESTKEDNGNSESSDDHLGEGDYLIEDKGDGKPLDGKNSLAEENSIPGSHHSGSYLMTLEPSHDDSDLESSDDDLALEDSWREAPQPNSNLKTDTDSHATKESDGGFSGSFKPFSFSPQDGNISATTSDDDDAIMSDCEDGFKPMRTRQTKGKTFVRRDRSASPSSIRRDRSASPSSIRRDRSASPANLLLSYLDNNLGSVPAKARRHSLSSSREFGIPSKRQYSDSDVRIPSSRQYLNGQTTNEGRPQNLGRRFSSRKYNFGLDPRGNLKRTISNKSRGPAMPLQRRSSDSDLKFMGVPTRRRSSHSNNITPVNDTDLNDEDFNIAQYYKKLSKRGISENTVREEMKKDGIDSKIIDFVFKKEKPKGLNKDESKVSQYRRMLDMNIPPSIVRIKMERDGLEKFLISAILEDGKPTTEHGKDSATSTSFLSRKDQRTVEKYTKMITMMIPKEIVETKMRYDKVDAKIMSIVLGQVSDDSAIKDLAPVEPTRCSSISSSMSRPSQTSSQEESSGPSKVYYSSSSSCTTKSRMQRRHSTGMDENPRRPERVTSVRTTNANNKESKRRGSTSKNQRERSKSRPNHNSSKKMKRANSMDAPKIPIRRGNVSTTSPAKDHMKLPSEKRRYSTSHVKRSKSIDMTGTIS